MKDKIKSWQPLAFFGKALPVLAAILVTLCINTQTADAATEYPIWIGGTQVTSDNAGNVLNETNSENGEPTVSFDEATLTLTLNGVHITPDQYWVNDSHKDWNDPYATDTWGGDYSKTGTFATVYSMFFGPIRGRRFYGTTDNGLGSRGTIVLKGENVIDGYGVGILAGKWGGNISTTGGDFSILGDGTLRINQLYSEKDGTPAPHGALNFLEMPVNVYFGEQKGHGPKIYCNGIKSGFYSPLTTAVPTAKETPLLNERVTFYLYGDTILALQGGMVGLDTRYYKFNQDAFNHILPKDQSLLCAKSTGAISGPEGIAPSAALTAQSLSHTSSHYLSYDEKVFGMLLGESSADVGNWVVYGPLTMKDEFEITKILNLPATNLNPNSDAYVDPDINVWGHTEDGTVYSVDVEWGAMTFQYEKSSWDLESHTTKEGRGWLIYDAVNEKALASKQDLINQVTVTNHSNAEVYATLSYTGEDDYTETTGSFTKKEDDLETTLTEASETGEDAAKKTIPAYLTLGTADNGKGELEGQGKATVGTVYFMPEGIAKTGDAVNDITQWTKIGTITVGLLTEDTELQPTN